MHFDYFSTRISMALCGAISTKFLFIFCYAFNYTDQAMYFEIQKYLVLTCTWWPKYLILVQVLKYFCQINKYSVLNLWICSRQQFTTEHHKQKWFILCVLTAWVSGCQQSGLDCLLDLQAQHWDLMTQYSGKILGSLVQVAACLQFGASHYNQIDTL